jgi:hypothetical protein
MLIFAGLFALWVGIELLASSHWLEIRSILDRSLARPPAADKLPLKELLLPRSRLWFAPYITFPETGLLESRLRKGVYDTFLAFPSGGITTNYGAFKLSAADSAFAQASRLGLVQEAALASRLGYQWFAVDLGSLQDQSALIQRCDSRSRCRISRDGYALIRLDPSSRSWQSLLSVAQRRMPGLPELSASASLGSLVFQPGRWWPASRRPLPAAPQPAAGDAGFAVAVRPVWQASVYRYAPGSLPRALQPILAAPTERIWLRLAPGLRGVDLCLHRQVSLLGFKRWGPCTSIELRLNKPRVEITHLLPKGGITDLRTEWIFGDDGLPITVEMLPVPESQPEQPSAFSVEVSRS